MSGDDVRPLGHVEWDAAVRPLTTDLEGRPMTERPIPDGTYGGVTFKSCTFDVSPSTIGYRVSSTDAPVPDAAVQIVSAAIFVHPDRPQNQLDARAAVAALAAAGWLHDPGDTPVPDAAVQVAAEAMGGYFVQETHTARDVVAALARAGWLAPAEVAALRAVADAARDFLHSYAADLDDAGQRADRLDRALDALGSGAQ